jgi:hypothetical protein
MVSFFFDFFACRFQQEFEKFSQQHTADMAELKQAHEAEMAASHAREEANLTQVNERKADRKVSKSKPEAVSSLHRSCAAMRSSLNQRTKSRQDEISTNYDYHLCAHNACLQEKLIESMRDQHARDMQAWQDRLQRELQAQDEVCSVVVTSSR